MEIKDVHAFEQKVLDLEVELRGLRRKKDELREPQMYNHVGTLRVNLTVLRNQINNFLDEV